MTPEEEAAIRERDAIAVTFDSVGEHTNVLAAMGDIDRRALLRYVDELRAAAGRVRCTTCGGIGVIQPANDEDRSFEPFPCPDCAALRALLSPRTAP